jgi:hypothetical protein
VPRFTAGTAGTAGVFWQQAFFGNRVFSIAKKKTKLIYFRN